MDSGGITEHSLKDKDKNFFLNKNSIYKPPALYISMEVLLFIIHKKIRIY